LRISTKPKSSDIVRSGAESISIVLPIKLKTPSGTCPMPPQFGHGPDLLPAKLTFMEFSTKNPELKAAPQVSQKAGTMGILSLFIYKLDL
jgi:hypothetical protein